MDADIDTPSTEDQLGGALKGRPQSGAWGVKKSNGLNLPKATASSRTAGRKMRGVLSPRPKPSLMWKLILPIVKTRSVTGAAHQVHLVCQWGM